MATEQTLELSHKTVNFLINKSFLQNDFCSCFLYLLAPDEPDCFLNTTDDTIQAGDFMRVTCNVTYAAPGQITPLFDWTVRDGTPIRDVTTIIGFAYIVSYIERPALPGIEQSFSCLIYFGEPSYPQPPVLTRPATNVPNFTKVYNVVEQTVLCKLF